MRFSVFRSLVRPSLLARTIGRYPARGLHSTPRVLVVKPFLLADIGEGIRECEIIQWFVEPGARVEEFDKICEVQSDKASVDIPSRFSGVIKKLHYEAGQMAIVGKPLIDIDVPEDVQDDEALAAPVTSETISPPETTSLPSNMSGIYRPGHGVEEMIEESPNGKKSQYTTLATPAVRHLSKELDVDISNVKGTGKDGRVTKDDIYKFAAARDTDSGAAGVGSAPQPSSISRPFDNGPQKETVTQLSKIQAQMFKTMTRSLNIPHFLYADEVDFSSLVDLRRRLNASLAKSSGSQQKKLSLLSFIVKAMSLSLNQYPLLNARVDIDNNGSPSLIMRSQHNIGIAMDTPQGLIVPVIKNVASLDILSIDNELKRLQSLANLGRLTTADLSGGTITLSNIGNIGGTYVSPVIVDKEVAILGMGRTRTIPAFDDAGNVVKKQVCNFSWCADHRVVDGATMARAAEIVRGFVEEPDTMMVHLR